MNLTQYRQYFKDVATNHKLIQDFVHYSMLEFADKFTVSLKSPVLGIEDPTYQGSGNFSNRRWEMQGAVTMMKKTPAGNHATNRLDQEVCVSILEEIAAKMVYDRKLYDEQNKDFVITGLEITSFNIELMPGKLHGEFVGARMTFILNRPAQFFDEKKWIN